MKMPVLIFVCLLFFTKLSKAQPCTVNISSFPFQEGFETSSFGWGAFGTSSDWTWDSPSKYVITGAAEGVKCWFTGGYGSNGYNNGENAWLLSPCFNFSTLVNPEISFKVFWETEQRFDGANLQYSTNNGTTWTILGDINSNSNCNGSNWYNTGAVTYIGNAVGWSGNVQPTSGSCLGGNGSGRWLTARHTLGMLAGAPNVRFRFLFGAGTTCNAYDGFAVDDIKINETPPVTAPVAIQAVCINTDTRSFVADGPCIRTYSWNFNDPASGAANTATGSAVQHQFSTPGIYNVKLTSTTFSNQQKTDSIEVIVIGATGVVSWPGACSNIPDATITTTSTGSPNPYIYNWNTNPSQGTASISNIGAGSYTVIVSSIGACAAVANFTLESGFPAISVAVTNTSCGAANGSVVLTFASGSSNYQYTWSNGAGGSSLQNILPGNYSVNISNSNGCSTQQGPFEVINIDNALAVNLGPDLNLCPGQQVVLNAGNFSGYTWQDGSSAFSFTIKSAGKYYVSVRDAQGCVGADTVNVSMDCRDIYFPSAFTPNNDSRNDFFGPIGNLTGLRNYTLTIFDRYGNRVFFSRDPYEKWNGQYKAAKPNTGAFVWMSSFILNGQQQSRKGTITIIR